MTLISGVVGSSSVTFPKGEGTSGVCCSEGTEEWDDGIEECVEAVSSWDGAEAALEALLDDDDLR